MDTSFTLKSLLKDQRLRMLRADESDAAPFRPEISEKLQQSMVNDGSADKDGERQRKIYYGRQRVGQTPVARSQVPHLHVTCISSSEPFSRQRTLPSLVIKILMACCG